MADPPRSLSHGYPLGCPPRCEDTLPCGMRPGEYTGLRWEDVDFGRQAAGGSASYLAGKQRQAAYRLAAGTAWEDWGIVFADEIGRPIDQYRLRRRFYSERWCPREDSNLRSRFRKPLLYPLSYGGAPWILNLRGRLGTLTPAGRRWPRCQAAAQRAGRLQGYLGRMAARHGPPAPAHNTCRRSLRLLVPSYEGRGKPRPYGFADEEHRQETAGRRPSGIIRGAPAREWLNSARWGLSLSAAPATLAPERAGRSIQAPRLS
jgi:hypothetical protein